MPPLIYALLYVLPVIVIALVVFLARKGQAAAIQKAQSMTPEEGRQKLNDYFASNFDLQPGETLWATWIGEEYQGEKSTKSQVAGALLNQASKAAIGISTYVPTVRIATTSARRVLVAREYSVDGDRGNFKQIAAFNPGTRAVDAVTAYPDRLLTPRLKNPVHGAPAPVFVQFVSPTGERYEAWMTAGQTTGPFISTFNETYSQIPGA